MKPQVHGFLSIILILGCLACENNSDDLADTLIEEPDSDQNPDSSLYFPGTTTDEWQIISPQALGWNANAIQDLIDFLEEKDTKAFVILKDGKIAMEEYFGTFKQDSLWYWASAGKTLTAFTVGIALEKQLLDLNDKTSDYLGQGWTSAPPEKEDLITIKNQLTMTSGLKDMAFDCVTPDCLEYEGDANSRWAYHNGPYTLLEGVVSEAAGTSFSAFFNSNLRDRIGMEGFWLSTNGLNNVYFSTARSMARFGLLNLNNGMWNETTILGDMEYISEMKNTSQELNKSYGYLWWLNGKESYMAPSLQLVFNGSLIPNAPADTYAGLGKNDQKLYVVPSKGLVIVRMGEDAAENLLGPSSFDNALWEKLGNLIN
ncbi:MAG: serine hydrolase [Eudoraea sp.]|nr:serine hydrolase [Eudoraea sp.]